MRGTWDQAEPLILAPEQHQQLQQHQHQHQTIVDGDQHRAGHPLHSPTTPAWGSIADRIVVKEEPQEDKNNDSGISPGHYTSESASPHSRRSSSTANCSLSPGSASSQDSNSMQINGYEYSPQRLYKPCDSPLDYARTQNGTEDTPATLMQTDRALTSDVVSSSTARSNHEEPDSIEVSPDPLQCPICTFSTQSRLQFTEHLASHCNVAAKCDASEFTKSVMEQLTNGGNIGSPDELSRASPTQNERNSEHESEEVDEPGLRVPRVNSQGKVKTFRCKQCNFVAITKLDFWEHSRCHIKAEKLLTCPKCPFVTEYKHHLEYHLRNHFGSKPYKCDKCSYSCVNKSMLNSHLKSHSNVYQFRCADCSYATKYCHSLKLHLRKYEHKPAMVLNADGSPNPLPIIDVYGTRRGPKTKPKKEQESTQQVTNGLVNALLPTVVPQQQPSPLGHQFQFNGMAKLNAFTGNGFNGAASPNGLGLPTAPTLIGFPYNQLFGGYPIPNPFTVNAANEETSDKQMERLKANFMEYTNKASEAKVPEEFSPGKFNQNFNGNSEPANEYNGSLPLTVTIKEEEPESAEMKSAPLDLSKPEQTETRVVPPAVSTNSPRISGTSRRKGRAIKLDRRVIENDSDEEMRNGYEVLPPSASPGSTDSKDSKDSVQTTHFAGVGMSNEFTCQYCEISFGNEVMHSVHMGYHGYQNPYTCNMCGIQCTDKVSFFLHIARSKH